MKLMPIVLSVILANPVMAEETAQFLKLGVGARALGMGGAYTAIADDVSALSWNPAGLSLLPKRELGAMHAQLSDGMTYNFLGYAHPTRYGVWGAGAMHMSQGSLQGRDASGRVTGDFSASDTAAIVSYGRKLSLNLGLGVTTKFIRSQITDQTGQTLAFDVGGLYQFQALGPGIPRLGVSVQNMGPELSLGGRGSSLPLTFATGLSYGLPVGLTLALDLKRRPHAGTTEVSVGTEYAVIKNFALRAGYASNHGTISGSRRVNDLSGFATGFGIKAYGLSLDYSITPYGGLGNAHRVSLGSRF